MRNHLTCFSMIEDIVVKRLNIWKSFVPNLIKKLATVFKKTSKILLKTPQFCSFFIIKRKWQLCPWWIQPFIVHRPIIWVPGYPGEWMINHVNCLLVVTLQPCGSWSIERNNKVNVYLLDLWSTKSKCHFWPIPSFCQTNVLKNATTSSFYHLQNLLPWPSKICFGTSTWSLSQLSMCRCCCMWWSYRFTSVSPWVLAFTNSISDTTSPTVIERSMWCHAAQKP